jgi:hypothetical protein
VWVNGDIASLIGPCTRSSSGQHYAFTAYSWRKNPRYPLVRRLGGPRDGLQAVAMKKVLALDGNRTPIAHPIAYSPAAVL